MWHNLKNIWFKSYVPSSDTFNYFYRPYARYVVLLKSQAEQKFTFWMQSDLQFTW